VDFEGNMIEPMIETTKVTHGFIYTIVKYEHYQDAKNYESNNESSNEGIMKEQRRERGGNNKYKNLKNYNNDNNITPYKENESDESQLKFPLDSIEYRLADFLRKWVKKNNTTAKLPDDAEMDAWSRHIDYMIRLDNRSVEDIKDVIEFSQKDEFWMTNILSTAKLRKQFDQLYIKSKLKNKASIYPVNNEQKIKQSSILLKVEEINTVQMN